MTLAEQATQSPVHKVRFIATSGIRYAPNGIITLRDGSAVQLKEDGELVVLPTPIVTKTDPALIHEGQEENGN